MDSNEPTPREVIAALQTGTTEQKVAALAHMVLVLLVEVEALRDERLRSATASGNRTYDQAYQWAAKLRHNAAGTQTGLEKLLAMYLGSPATDETPSCRETIMLRRMGLSDDQIREFERQCAFVSQLS